MPPLPLRKFHAKTQALLERLKAASATAEPVSSTQPAPQAVDAATTVPVQGLGKAWRCCVACGGTGRASKGSVCYPCAGTGRAGEQNRRLQHE